MPPSPLTVNGYDAAFADLISHTSSILLFLLIFICDFALILLAIHFPFS